MEYATSVFAALSDPLRLRCLALMAREGELCVCELGQALQVSQPKISKHLAILREARLVRDRRESQWVYYAISSDLSSWASQAVGAAVAALETDATHLDDHARLLDKAARPHRQRAA